MSAFTQGDLATLMRECGGEDHEDLSGSILDIPFAELGYDSLALLEITTRIENRYSVSIPEDIATGMKTPREAIAYVNSLIRAA
jgi:minimal PKS acyl carrier protein